MKHTIRGFTLLIAVVLSSVMLSVALALIDVAYKQVILALTARQSSYAFYAADAAIECALYYDQKQQAFDYDDPVDSIECRGQTLDFDSAPNSTVQDDGARITTLTVPCATGGAEAMIIVYKWETGTPSTRMYARGYSSCDVTDMRRVERGLNVEF